MKKRVFVILSLLCAAGLVFAADNASTSTTPWVDKGNLLVNVGIGWGGLSGGAEYDFARVDIAKVVPVTFGAAARALVNPGIFDASYASFEFGVGGFITAHFGFKELAASSGLAWLAPFDLYAGLGAGFGSATLASDFSGSAYTLKPGFGFSTFEGTSYYLNSKLAINFEYGYVGQVGYTWDLGYGIAGSYYWPLSYETIGVVLKL